MPKGRRPGDARRVAKAQAERGIYTRRDRVAFLHTERDEFPQMMKCKVAPNQHDRHKAGPAPDAAETRRDMAKAQAKAVDARERARLVMDLVLGDALPQNVGPVRLDGLNAQELRQVAVALGHGKCSGLSKEGLVALLAGR